MRAAAVAMVLVLGAPALLARQAAGPAEEKGQDPDAIFQRAERLYADFVKMPVGSETGDMRELSRQLQAKAQRIQEVQLAYQKLLEMKSREHIVAATFRMGCAYEQMGLAMRSIPVPAGLTEEQAEAFRKAIELQGGSAFEDRALHFFKAALRWAIKFERMDDPFTGQCIDKVHGYIARYRKAGDARGQALYDELLRMVPADNPQADALRRKLVPGWNPPRSKAR
ncbi:MAG: hypothetical protein JXR96_14190 [Deltaproteobacteria bacterium]|nr:hypothetical protein [Deltaproteobacteria bacterium]